MVILKLAVFVVTLLGWQCEGYQMTRCQLVEQLRKHGFAENLMRDWVCLVESESSRMTDVVSKPNRNGSRDYGLFQVNNGWWCSNTTQPGMGCNVTCADLITDDITTAVECSRIIFKRQGFHAWHGWTKRCQNKALLPDIANCTQAVQPVEVFVYSVTALLGWV